MADPLTGTPPADQFHQNDLLSQQRDGYGTHEDVGVRHDRQGLPLRLACAALWIAHASMKGSRAVQFSHDGAAPLFQCSPAHPRLKPPTRWWWIWATACRCGCRWRAAFSLDGAFEAIRALSQRLGTVLREVQPTKASVKYGLELEVRDGALLATLVRGGGKTSLEVTLEWEQPQGG